MEWIGWLYLSYFNVLYLAGLFWGLDEFLASRVVLTVVVSLHFVAGGIAGLQKGAEAVRERYSLAFGIGWINIFADALLLAALAVVWISEPLLYAAAGFATLGNSFCLAGHLRHKKLYQEGKYTADLAGGSKSPSWMQKTTLQKLWPSTTRTKVSSCTSTGRARSTKTYSRQVATTSSQHHPSHLEPP